ncbi:flagellar basal body P-ring protein FlgI [Chromobacterium subtsugae]|uniref:Flagellar P-ring protein n=1 Tax=Chromobacterium subtsugae TaxID=251747 RepID=A0ABS7FBA5_9NEIS|nr:MULTISPECIES: flagellar basal body P-ring protein FlgI [Chromobacterium]KUM01674.1 flagellar biosynthesis protein FlgI [Chromobacterium subtsugae]KZE84547.1 flagellar biosynthesis protein FlgI [Chromobacterium sp. F49]MBW7566240.1 flagellar basal body P-ring protein FlgI [Chromobacterium subtsugae]MBW8287361.1 flagellar basal body P-ring protein FlgI [Chromobacterium subtsugae]OBU87500.1 flagellar P-ring protein FlgI [Chromobacterium subtsugae]
MKLGFFRRLLAVVVLAACAPLVCGQPLRQMVNVEGIRDNQLIGYGIVVGLDGTGDNSQVKFSGQSVANMLKQFGLKMPEKTDTRVKNVAAVMVSASLPPGYSRGQTIDVTVSSLGDAKSLRGGTLLLTQLKAANGEVYALAQGSVVIGGLSAQGKSGSSVTVNTPTAGRIPNGASIEREIPSDFEQGDSIRLSLRRPSFETASNVVKAINQSYGKIASTRNATTIEVKAPADPTERVAFVARLERLNVNVGAELPRVVFNSRTGTVVISEGVTVRPAAVSHGSLRVVISESSQVSQPGPFSNGDTKVVPNSNVNVEQGSGRMFKWPAGASLRAIIDAVNRTGATPDDIMAILQALDQAGAIDGELIVI